MVRPSNRMCKIDYDNLRVVVLIIVPLLNIWLYKFNTQVITKDSHISHESQIYRKCINHYAHAQSCAGRGEATQIVLINNPQQIPLTLNWYWIIASPPHTHICKCLKFWSVENLQQKGFNIIKLTTQESCTLYIYKVRSAKI